MSNETKSTGTPHVMRNVFGGIMILIYIGMGVLFYIGFFPWLSGSWEWLRWAGGTIFVVYGLWRGYRQSKEIDYADPE